MTKSSSPDDILVGQKPVQREQEKEKELRKSTDSGATGTTSAPEQKKYGTPSAAVSAVEPKKYNTPNFEALSGPVGRATPLMKNSVDKLNAILKYVSTHGREGSPDFDELPALINQLYQEVVEAKILYHMHVPASSSVTSTVISVYTPPPPKCNHVLVVIQEPAETDPDWTQLEKYFKNVRFSTASAKDFKISDKIKDADFVLYLCRHTSRIETVESVSIDSDKMRPVVKAAEGKVALIAFIPGHRSASDSMTATLESSVAKISVFFAYGYAGQWHHDDNKDFYQKLADHFRQKGLDY